MLAKVITRVRPTRGFSHWQGNSFDTKLNTLPLRTTGLQETLEFESVSLTGEFTFKCTSRWYYHEDWPSPTRHQHQKRSLTGQLRFPFCQKPMTLPQPHPTKRLRSITLSLSMASKCSIQLGILGLYCVDLPVVDDEILEIVPKMLS
jgi:hypothetical protein